MDRPKQSSPSPTAGSSAALECIRGRQEGSEGRLGGCCRRDRLGDLSSRIGMSASEQCDLYGGGKFEFGQDGKREWTTLRG